MKNKDILCNTCKYRVGDICTMLPDMTTNQTDCLAYDPDKEHFTEAVKEDTEFTTDDLGGKLSIVWEDD